MRHVSIDACHEHVTRCMYVCAVAQIFSSLVTLEAAINGNDFKPLVSRTMRMDSSIDFVLVGGLPPLAGHSSI